MVGFVAAEVEEDGIVHIGPIAVLPSQQVCVIPLSLSAHFDTNVNVTL